jgi:hypothetical protein
MVNPQAWITLPGESKPLALNAVVNIEVTHSMEMPISFATITIQDGDGGFFAEMRLKYGTPVKVAFVESLLDTQDSGLVPDESLSTPHSPKGYSLAKYVELHQWYIIGVEATSSSNIEKVQGMINVKLAHPWFIFRDTTNHAYGPMRHDELIKHVLSNSNRGMPFPQLIDENFEKTDDEGNISRYKVWKSDYDFIVDDVLPYTSIGFDHAFFWVDLWGDFHLQSFAQLIKQQPKVLFGPSPEGIQNDKIADKLAKVAKANGIDDGFQPVTTRRVTVYDYDNSEEYRDEIKPNFVVEDQNVGKMYAMGARNPNMKMPGDTGVYFPLPKMIQLMMRATSAKLRKARSLGDNLGSVFADSTPLIKTFVMEVTSRFPGQYCQPGMTAYVYMPPTTMPASDINAAELIEFDHWADGKWLIYKTEQSLNEGDKLVYTKTTLVRPTVVIKDPDATIMAVEDFWTIGG